MKTSLKETAYRHIRSKLLSRELKPGSSLSPRALAKEIGISFTPVRDAIGQLAIEGLLETHPKKGTTVVDISRDDLAELYDVREALECHAVAKSDAKYTEADFIEMEKSTDEMEAVAAEVKQAGGQAFSVEQSDRFMVADAAFHVALLRGAGNKKAIRIVNELRVMTRIFGHRTREALPGGDLTIVCRDHRELIQALRERNGEKARGILGEHLRRGCRRALAAFDRSRMEEAAGHGSWVTYPAELQGRIQELEEKAEGKDAREGAS
ncbi:MAG: GntR family transcriptional regulator [Pirellulales bacterium]|nr:GntR family transcriptional regulator [Pirellulales bacterium]